MQVRCVWLSTGIDDAQVNAVTRLIERYGHLPGDRELKQLRKTDVAAFSPSVLFRYQRDLEPPDPSEGFSSIEQVPFTRAANPAHVNRAVIAWCDDPSQLEPLAPALREHQDAGWTICVLSWQPGIEDGTRTDADVRASFADVGDRAGLRFDLDICPHGAGPPRCWCRKPLPGLGVALIHRHALDPAQCLFVGNGPQDAGFARKLGFRHVPTLTRHLVKGSVSATRSRPRLVGQLLGYSSDNRVDIRCVMRDDAVMRTTLDIADDVSRRPRNWPWCGEKRPAGIVGPRPEGPGRTGRIAGPRATACLFWPAGRQTPRVPR